VLFRRIGARRRRGREVCEDAALDEDDDDDEEEDDEEDRAQREMAFSTSAAIPLRIPWALEEEDDAEDDALTCDAATEGGAGEVARGG
jgi:hypothetical protein